MFKLTPLVRLSSGLVFLTVSILLLADLIGISPNQSQLVIEERRKLAEFLTIQLMKSVDEGQEKSIPAMLNMIYERNGDILSLAIRKVDGEILLEFGDHKENWNRTINEGSTADYIQVPVYKNGADWGRVELRYRSLTTAGNYVDLPIDNSMLLTLFVALMGYLLYSLFLKRTLKYLDPSSVIPDRVRNAMNALSEGVLVLDKKENIILANSSFCEKVMMDEKSLIGKKIGKLLWKLKDRESDGDVLPWVTVLNDNISVSSIALSLNIPQYGNRTFMVNASPVEDNDNNVSGMLCTFDDVTYIEEKNNELQRAMRLLEKTQVEINKKNEELSLLASTDPLTGCLNRRAFFETVEKKFEDRKGNRSISCIMLDIDYFKKVNDDFGHTVGDLVIRSLASTIRNTLREDDLLCRYGGEEFCVILFGTTAIETRSLAERARIQVQELEFKESSETVNMKITASFGITDTTFGAMSCEELVDQADRALYYSKENGRNKVSLWTDVVQLEKKKSLVKLTEEHEDPVPEISAPKDVLTGLSGRVSFMQVVKEAILSNSTEDELFAVILIDIDMFKRVNRSMGVDQGDLILQEFAVRLNAFIRDTDLLAHYGEQSEFDSITSRFGGNAFALLVKNFKNSSNIYAIAKRLLVSLSLPYVVNDIEIHLTFSLGMSLYPADGDTSESLIGNSELAMIRAKKEEGNTYRRYLKDLDSIFNDSMILENELRNAIKNQEFVVYYQPKVKLSDGSVSSVEALARWDHPDKGIIMPVDFIPLAESCGLIHLIGKQVMEIAFKQAAKWVDEGRSSFRVAINISAFQLLKKSFLEDTVNLMGDSFCSPDNIEFELTETVLVENFDFILPILTSLRDSGVKISIDDFGVGYSSLNYIKRLPVDTIKVDKSFVDMIHTKEEDAKLVAAVIAMAHAMGLNVVVEGVECRQQVEMLVNMKCDYVQGYFYSKPIPVNELEYFLRHDGNNLL